MSFTSKVIAFALLCSCGYSEAEMALHRDHEQLLETALKRLEDELQVCLVKTNAPPAPPQAPSEAQ